MTTYQESLAKHQAEQAAQAKHRQNRQVWREILSRYDGLADNTANYQMVLDYCDGEITVLKFAWMVDHDNAKLSWQDQRDELIGKILFLIHNPANDKDLTSDEKQMIDHELQTWRTKLKFFSTDQLRSKLTELLTKKALNEKSVTEIHGMLAEHRKAQSTTTPDGYKVIPDTIVPPWGQEAIPMKEYLDRIAKSDVLLLKRAVKVWGLRQVDSVRRGF